MTYKRTGGGFKRWKKMSRKEKLAVLAGSAALAHAGYKAGSTYSRRLQHQQNVTDLKEWVERGKWEAKKSRQRKARMRFKYPPPRPRKPVKASRKPPKKAAPKVKPLVPRRMPLSGPAKRKQRVVSIIRRSSFDLKKAKIATAGARIPIGPQKEKDPTEVDMTELDRLFALKKKNKRKAAFAKRKIPTIASMKKKAIVRKASRDVMRAKLQTSIATQKAKQEGKTLGGSLSVGGKMNPWLVHVKAHKKKNPKLSHKQALIAAKKTYRKKASGYGGKKK